MANGFKYTDNNPRHTGGIHKTKRDTLLLVSLSFVAGARLERTTFGL